MSLLQAFPTFWETPRRFLYSKCIMIFELVFSDPFSHEHPECNCTNKKFAAYPFCKLCVLYLENKFIEL